jgi:DNA-binding NarL/FixJ family response regulator/PAS domain-containing protein
MSPAPKDPARLSLVCIDDDTAVLDLFNASFNRDPDLTLMTFSSAKVALDRLKTLHADAIFCDYSMPDMDGIEFLKEIRSRGNNAYFVICTGRHLTKVAIDVLNNGGNYYLQKGLTLMDDLQKVIDQLKQKRASGAATASQAPSSSPSAENPTQSLIEKQFVPLCAFDRAGRIRYANEFYLDEIGGNVGEGAVFFSVIPEDERTEFMGHLKSLTGQNPAAHLLHHIRPNSGPLKLVLGNYRVFTDDSGKVTGYTALLTPMSGIISLSSLALHSLEEPKVKPEPVIQKVTYPPPRSHVPAKSHVVVKSHAPAKKKKVLKDYVTELSESVEHVQYPVFAIDTAGNVIAWNRAIAEITGVKAAEMLGRNGYAYSSVIVGEKRPMLVDYIVKTPHDMKLRKALGITHDGDVFRSDPDTAKLRGRTVHLWGKGAGIYDAEGSMIAAVQSFLVSTEPPAKKGRSQPEEETYIGGISSIILKVTDSGMGGAIAGAIGSAVGGYGVYVTDRRLFVIHNPFLDARRNDSISFGEFIIDELFGTNVDTRPRGMDELERHKVFEVKRKDITRMELRRPKLLAGSLHITTTAGGRFRVYIDHMKAFNHLEQVLKMSYPDILEVE